MTARTPTAFISYSHKDSEILDRLKLHLKPIIQKYSLSIWDDKQLRAGEKWRETINKKLAEADVIVVLLSADFLGSDFVMNFEYPQALSAANNRGAKIVVLVVSPCLYDEFDIADYHFVNDPDKTLQDIQADDTAAAHERTVMKCAAVIRDYLKEAEPGDA